MHHRALLPAATASLLIAASSLRASDDVSGASPSPTPVYLSEPEVVKMDWNTRSLDCADIDGDGLNDLAMIDNDSGKIEILYQNNPDNPRQKERRKVTRNQWDPVLEDAHFWHDGIMLGLTGYDLALGDLNGDGLTDIACTGNLTELTVFYQGRNFRWDKTWTYTDFTPMQWPDTMTIADIDGDGRNDLAILSTDEFLVFYQDDKGKLLEPRRYKLASSQAYGLTLADVNGDKLPDVLYMSGTDRFRRVSMRIQQEKGIFGPEVGFPMPTGSIGLALTHITPKPVLVTIEGKTRMIISFTLNAGSAAPSSLATLQMNDYTTGVTSKEDGLFTWGDYDGDGLTDIAVANPAGAEVILFRQRADGDFEEGRSYPSLSGINSICTLHTNGQPDSIVVASDDEDCAGIITYTKEGRLSLPAALPTEGKTVAVATGCFKTPGQDNIVVVEDEDDDNNLTLFSRNDTGEWERVTSTKIDNVRRKISGLMSLQVMPDGRDMLLVFPMKEAARIYTYGDDKFDEQEKDSPLRQSCFGSIDPSGIGTADVDGDGTQEMLVGGKGFIRAIRFTKDNTLEIADQYNSRNPNAEITGPCMIRFDKDPDHPRIVFYDSAAENMEMLERDSKDGVFRSVETRDNDTEGSPQDMLLMDLGQKTGPALLTTRQERFGITLLNKPGWVMQNYLPPYETDLDGVQYGGIGACDMTGDGVPELIAIDGRMNLIDILAEDRDTYRSVTHFVVFDKNQFSNNRSTNSFEPREYIMDDLNNDGLKDLAILVHDRVLIYSNQKIPESFLPAVPEK